MWDSQYTISKVTNYLLVITGSLVLHKEMIIETLLTSLSDTNPQKKEEAFVSVMWTLIDRFD